MQREHGGVGVPTRGASPLGDEDLGRELGGDRHGCSSTTAGWNRPGNGLGGLGNGLEL
jgi:hypothetical protein